MSDRCPWDTNKTIDIPTGNIQRTDSTVVQLFNSKKENKRTNGEDREQAKEQWVSLTNKQRGFVRAFVDKGMTESAAYRDAYDAENMNDNTVSREVSRLMVHPKISPIIKRRLMAREEATLHSAVSRRRLVLEGLTQIAKDSENDSVKVRALELLGKTAGVDLFRDVQATPEDTRPADEVLEEVAAKLKAAFGEG